MFESAGVGLGTTEVREAGPSEASGHVSGAGTSMLARCFEERGAVSDM